MEIIGDHVGVVVFLLAYLLWVVFVRPWVAQRWWPWGDEDPQDGLTGTAGRSEGSSIATAAEHAGLLTVTVATAVGVLIVGGAEEGKGAVLESVALALWVAWVRFGRPRRAARRASESVPDAYPATATPGPPPRMTRDDCITVLFVALMSQTALRYLVSAETGDGAMTVSAVVAVYLAWIYFGTRWLERRKAAGNTTST